ncbi:MAG: hypothetical protein AB7O59_18290 [Pirellulales bacterium]
MKRLILPMLAIALIAATALSSAAQENKAADGAKPVAVLSIASYDRIMADVAMFGNLAGNPDLDKNLEGMLKLFTQGQGLAGLDQTRPWCISLTTDDVSFQPLVYLPVDDLKKLLEALAGLVGDAEDAGDGLYGLNVFGQPIMAKQKDKWAIIGQTAEAVNGAPSDPTKLLAGLETSYDVAIRLYVQNIPEVYRSMAIDQLRAGVESGLGRMPDESDADYETRKKITEKQLDALTSAINDVDQITLGAAVDTTAKTAHIDLSFSAVAGSESAKQLSQMKATPSDFAGFLDPEAAASLNITTEIAKDSSGQIAAALSTIRSSAMDHVDKSDKLTDEGSKQLAKEMLGEVFDALQGTLESGKIDAAATLQVSDKSMALVVGAYVADPQALESALKKFSKLAEKEPNFPTIKFDADSHEGVRFHTASIPVPQDKGIAKVLGEKLDVAVGIGAKSVYLALGTDSLKLTKSLIDKSKAQAGKELPPFQLNVSLAPIFEFAAAMQSEEDRKNVMAMAEALAKSDGKDKVRLVFMPQKDSMLIRLEAEEGVLRLLANAGKMLSAAGGAGFPGAP